MRNMCTQSYPHRIHLLPELAVSIFVLAEPLKGLIQSHTRGTGPFFSRHGAYWPGASGCEASDPRHALSLVQSFSQGPGRFVSFFCCVHPPCPAVLFRNLSSNVFLDLSQLGSIRLSDLHGKIVICQQTTMAVHQCHSFYHHIFYFSHCIS